MEKGWIKIYSTYSEADAVIKKQHLENNDIKAVTINKQDSFYKILGEIELYVPGIKVIKAKQLISI
jgi:5'(3')-deoxyribonucleotidase